MGSIFRFRFWFCGSGRSDAERDCMRFERGGGIWERDA